MDDASDPPVRSARSWGVRRTLGYSLLVGVAAGVIQVAVLFVMLMERIVNDPDVNVEDWLLGAESNGVYVSIATIATALLCVPFVKRLVSRRESNAWSFLRFVRVGARPALYWVLALVAFAVVSDLIMIAIGHPVVPEFTVAIFASSPPALLQSQAPRHRTIRGSSRLSSTRHRDT